MAGETMETTAIETPFQAQLREIEEGNLPEEVKRQLAVCWALMAEQFGQEAVNEKLTNIPQAAVNTPLDTNAERAA